MRTESARPKRVRCLRAALLALLLAPGIAVPAFSQDGRSIAAAREIFALTNQDRQAQGLQPLAWNDALAGAARAHAVIMAQEPQLSHQYPGEPPLLQRAAAAGAHFQSIAENVAMAPNPQAVENAWMHSTPHRTNILDPKMNALGVGVVERGGYLYAVEDFAEAQPVLDARQVEERVRQLLRAQNIDASLAPEPAEQACAMDRGMPAGTRARSMVRFETPDLSQLPPAVIAQIRSGGFTQAAVGACAPLHDNPAFTTYRVALLLY